MRTFLFLSWPLFSISFFFFFWTESDATLWIFRVFHPIFQQSEVFVEHSLKISSILLFKFIPTFSKPLDFSIFWHQRFVCEAFGQSQTFFALDNLKKKWRVFSEDCTFLKIWVKTFENPKRNVTIFLAQMCIFFCLERKNPEKIGIMPTRISEPLNVYYSYPL